MAITGSVPLANGFDPASSGAWRDMVLRGLKGNDFSSLVSQTADGIELQPLHEASTDPAIDARPAGSAWRIAAIADQIDPTSANRQIIRDLNAGTTCISLAFENAPSAGGFGLPADDGTLAMVLQDVFLDLVDLRIEPHPLGRRSASWLAGLFEKRSTEPARSSVSFGLDPIGNFARWGALSVDENVVSERLATTTAKLRDRGFSGRFAEADGRVYHAAGASDGQELGAVLAIAAWYLRAFGNHGAEPGEAFASIGVSLAADQLELTVIAKMRAMRLLWQRLQELCGGDRMPLRLHAETAQRMMMVDDPHTNILRTTLAAFSAGIGGADSIAILPYSWALGLPDRSARRMARNLHHLMLEESNLHRVTDPAAGSGAIEVLTDGLCEAAWSEFQTIESEGGIIQSLKNGKMQGRIAGSRQKLQDAIAAGDVPLVGVTAYPNAAKQTVDTVDATRRPDPVFSKTILTCEPLVPMPRQRKGDSSK